MATDVVAISPATVARIERAAGELATAASQHMEASHGWYRSLRADDRSAVGALAQSGIGSFLGWLRSTDAADRDAIPTQIFAMAPASLVRAISLGQTLDLVRTVVEVVERDVVTLAELGEESQLREATLVFSREVAFAAAQAYADAAETRGAWDARLEELVVDAVLRGEADESLASRAAALGWGTTDNVAVLVASTPSGVASEIDALHRDARKLGLEALASVQGRRLVVILGGATDALTAAGKLTSHFGDGPIIVGPSVPHLFAAGRSARAALAGHSVAAAWPEVPRPALADDLLAERALIGDQPARTSLVDRIYRPLRASPDQNLLTTAQAYLECGASLEAAARQLYVHPNTVRYRLGSIEEATGYRLTSSHDAFTVRIALALGRLGRSGTPRDPRPL